jgi:glutamate-1-semialdehyde 2,1-aminomutase
MDKNTNQDRREFIKNAAGSVAGVVAASSMVVVAAEDKVMRAEDVCKAAQGNMHSTQAMKSPMASQRPWDMVQARKWAPNVDATDFTTIFPQLEGVISQEKLLELANEQLDEFMAKTQKSKEMQNMGKAHMPFGVFGCYQKDWETPHLFYAEKCYGGKLWDVDGNEYVDFNLGDTPGMFGHGAANKAIKAAAERMLVDGIDPMMGTADQIEATRLLADRFGLPQWMHALTASDANRYALAIARHHTGRQNVAIPNFTYHGAIDETQKMMPEPGVISRYHDMALYSSPVDQGTKVFIWNDLESVEEVLADRTVACVVIEPVMSNFGWAWPKEGWHAGLKALCDKYGTLLLIDETHTINGGPNGMVGALGIKGNYDFWTCGKCISSGFPGAVFGMSSEIAEKMQHDQHQVGFLAGAGLGMLGNALSGNTISSLALKVTLEEYFTEESFAPTLERVARMKKGMEASIEKYGAPFRIETMGARLCYHFIPEQVHDPIAGLVQVGFGGLFELSHFMAWNRGYLIMPYFNMILVAPQHTQDDINGWLECWDDFVRIAMGK